MKHEIRYGSTEKFAEIHLVKPETVRRSYCLNGHYFHIRPKKRLNGRLCWPLIANPNELENQSEGQS